MTTTMAAQTIVTLDSRLESHHLKPIQSHKRLSFVEIREATPELSEPASPIDNAQTQTNDTAPQPAAKISITQSALLVTENRIYSLVHDLPVPESLGPDEVMIRNYATGLNHIDWKSVDYNFCLPELPWITGREMSGVVERVGSDVTKCRVGDRVWTSKSMPPSE